MDKKYYRFDQVKVAEYVCLKTPVPLVINGRLDKEAWEKAPKSARFVDLVTGQPAFLDTRIAALWDEQYFYLAFWVEEPDVRAQFTERDSFIWLENDVEVFIAGPDCYYELQVNALGTIYEVFYIWQDALKPGSFFDQPEFNLTGRKVDLLAGFQDASRYGRHPRGKRWAFMDWDFPGLKWAVQVEGTLNNSSDVDRGWTVEFAFPWSGMTILAQGRSLPPRDGDIWRMSFSRFEALEANGRKIEPSIGWSLNPHGVYDSHIPELFSQVIFSEKNLS
ncbi:MAG: carbohydrate-binding family 9-like protein [Candidatus Aminicenantes bacterium]|nr:carbohydrate-binding family 9-like protein [Candidatus Aminicenantes bacterium]